MTFLTCWDRESLKDTHIKNSCHVQSASTANGGFKLLPSHRPIALQQVQQQEGPAQTQRWNTKTSKTGLIVVIQRYLKMLNGQNLDKRERGGMCFGSKALRKVL